jgi:STE24 endopeptidase
MKIALLVVYLLVCLLRFGLDWLNLRHRQLHSGELPRAFADQIDAQRMRQSDAYALAGDKLGFVEDIFGVIVTLLFLFGGILPWYDRTIGSLSDSFVAAGLLFFGLMLLAQGLLGLPFSLYRNFVLEERFGFNRMSFRIWLSDLVKSLLVGAVLFVLIGGGALALVQWLPNSWWLCVWLFWALVSLFLLYLSPSLIEPLFFKFTPLKKPSLDADVRSLLERAGVKAGKVLQVDASRRSGHSNAYFTGIGKVKRVVLFDTLLGQLEDRELLAVLAHELGHWRCGHLRMQLIKSQLMILGSCLLAFSLLQADVLPGLLGLKELSFAAQMMLLMWLGSLVGFFWRPLASWLSRRQEHQADDFAVDLIGSGAPLAGGLIKLARENLSNLFPHPLYVFFYYSHPPLLARVARLQPEE